MLTAIDIFCRLLFAGYLAITDKDYLFLLSIAIATVATVFTDLFFCYLKNKKITVTESSVVSGLIIGFVLSPETGIWLAAVAGIVAILFKHIIRFRKSHIFNPAGAGILFSIFVFGFWFDTGTQWNGAYSWCFLVPAGVYFAYRMRRLEIVAGYYIIYFCCFGIQALLQEMPISRVLMFVFYFVGFRYDADLAALMICNAGTPLLNRL